MKKFVKKCLSKKSHIEIEEFAVHMSSLEEKQIHIKRTTILKWKKDYRFFYEILEITRSLI